MDSLTDPFGRQLRRWRQRRGCSQLALADAAQVSTRHLSWLETGKSQPSRAMVLRLAEQLDVPLRERNAWLAAAGYAQMFKTHAPTDAAFASQLASVQALLDAHEPWPALAIDRHWNLVAHNRTVRLMLASVAPTLMRPPINVLRVTLHPQGLAPLIVDLPRWHGYVLARLRRQHASTHDPELARLLDELNELAPPTGAQRTSTQGNAEDARDAQPLTMPLSLRTPLGEIHLMTAVTLFGAPNDVTLSELAIETLLPADAASAERLRALHAHALLQGSQGSGAHARAATANLNP